MCPSYYFFNLYVYLKGLLDLLIERYHVPEALIAFSIQNTNTLTSKVKEDIKRYRKKYYQPIQVRYVFLLWLLNFMTLYPLVVSNLSCVDVI